MTLLHRYILTLYLKNFGTSLAGLTLLFLIFDFIDRLDNLLTETGSFGLILLYFTYKIPSIVNLMLPVASLVATLFTVGLLARKSELTAMRAGGLTVVYLVRPILIAALIFSFASIALGELVVPYATRREKEIYNIDIQQKDKRGNYSQTDFWWRDKNTFYAVSNFDSRTNTLLGFSSFALNENFEVQRRVIADQVHWLDPTLKWSMLDVHQYSFTGQDTEQKRFHSLPLTINEAPQDFYDVKTEPETMSYFQLQRFIDQQRANGINTIAFVSDLNGKIAFPFIIAIITFLVVPFALKPARTGTMASSSVAALLVGFTYYAVHSFSLSLGRAEIWPPVLAAWTANLVMGFVGLILNLGSESPS